IACLADAVEYAHSRGVLHRDIKPDNVLLEPVTNGALLPAEDGGGYVPKLTDFGLAKYMASGDDQTGDLHERSGIAFGTPAYMAPEQATGRHETIGVGTDVYALGGLMYRLLAGRTPIRGETPQETLQRISSEVPVPPRQLRDCVPRDVQAICMKCLQKKQEHRYASARDLADDLRRYLAGEPIAARPSGPLERVWRAALRHPAAAALLVVLLVGTITGLVGLSIHNKQLGAALRRAETSERTTRSLLYGAVMQQAWEAWHARDFLRARQALAAAARAGAGGTVDHRGFEWHLLARLTPPRLHQTILGFHRGNATSVRYSPDGKLLASAGSGGILRIWAMPEGRERHVLAGHEGDINRISFSPDGRTIATASDDGSAKLWNVDSGDLERVLEGHPRRVFEVVWSLDGNRLASAGDGEGIRVWDVHSGQLVSVLPARNVTAMAVWPQTGRLVSAEKHGGIRIWDFTELRQIGSFDPAHLRDVEQITFSSDAGRMLTASRDGTVREWDLASYQLLNLFQGHLDAVHAAGYLPDTNLIATASRDRTIRIWRRSGRQMSVIRGHSDCVWSLDMAPDGRMLVTAGRDGTVRLCRWSDWVKDDAERVIDSHITATENSTAYAPDGSRFAAISGNGSVLVHHVGDASPAMRLGPLEETGRPVALEFAPDGRSLLTGSIDGKLVVWNLNDASHETLTVQSGRIWDIKFAPDGTAFATCGEDAETRLWNWPGLSRRAQFGGHDGLVLDVSFTPDGQTFATCGSDGQVILWNMASGEIVQRLRTRTGMVHAIQFTADGEILAAACHDGTVQFWNRTTGTLVRTLSLADEQVWCLDFTPDGRTLVTGGSRAIRLWHRESGQPLAVFRSPHYGVCRSVTFSPDGRALLAVAGNDTWNGTLRLWSCDIPDTSPGHP
ncbi:MAG: protein kinase, partial [Maioricimonas sp. JB049]